MPLPRAVPARTPPAPAESGAPSKKATARRRQGGVGGGDMPPSSAWGSTGHAATTPTPGGSRRSPTKRKGLPRIERQPERAVVERAIDVLRDVPGMVRQQKNDPLLVQATEALGGENGTTGRGRLGEKEVTRYFLDDRGLEWYKLEQRGILARRTLVLAVPRGLVPNSLGLVNCQSRHPRVGRTFSLLRDRFHWPGMCRDSREYILSSGCRRRK